MTIGEYIKNHAKEEGRKLNWVANALEMNYKTFAGKLARNTLSAEELLRISAILDINLEFMKCEVDFAVKSNRKFIYVVENISDEDVLNKERIVATPMEVMEESYIGKLAYDTVYAFSEISDEDDSVKYEIKEISNKNLKKCDNVISVSMIRITPDSSLFIKEGKKIAPGTF